jgi:hypothetical protein
LIQINSHFTVRHLMSDMAQRDTLLLAISIAWFIAVAAVLIAMLVT